MTRNASESLLAFAREIGWRFRISQGELVATEPTLSVLAELAEAYAESARWSSDYIGKMNYPDNKETCLGVARSYVAGDKIWRVYERAHTKPSLPRYQVARRSPNLDWDRMGYFEKWPSCWAKERGLHEDLAPLATQH